MKKKVTMKNIAEALNLSINAVSLAINNKNGVGNETRNRIINVAEEMGYFDGHKKYGRVVANKNICILIKTQYFRNSNFYARVLLGVEKEARKDGYDVLINFDKELLEVPDCVKSGRVCGIISIGCISDEYLVDLKRYGIPIVMVDNDSMKEPIDCVVSDNKLGSYKITNLLIKRGYKKIGFFGDLDYSMSIKERFFGYCQAIGSLPNIRNYFSECSYALRYSVLKDIEKSIIKHDTPKLITKVNQLEQIPEAFVCSNDEAAIQLIYALNKLNYRVPEDIVVTGFDNAALFDADIPKFATVNVRKEFMGQVAVRKLLWRKDHADEPFENIVLSVEVINGDSIKFARG